MKSCKHQPLLQTISSVCHHDPVCPRTAIETASVTAIHSRLETLTPAIYVPVLTVPEDCCVSLVGFQGLTLGGMTAGIKWGGILQVQFTVPVTPQVFHKVFYKCQNYKVAPASSQEAGELVDDNETVTLDRDDIVKVFGVVSLLSVLHVQSILQS